MNSGILVSCLFSCLLVSDAGYAVSPNLRSHSLLSLADDASPLFVEASKPRIRAKSSKHFGRDARSDQDDDNRNVTTAECGKDFEANADVRFVCPSSCPFKVANSNSMCFYQCITENQCVNHPERPASVADAKTGLCEACHVPGCDRCHGNDECVKCSEGYDLVQKKCLPSSRRIWHTAYIVLGVIVAIILCYVICLAWRKAVNPLRLQQAINYRAWSKPRDDGRNMQLYPINTNLCNEFVSGTGVLLHFRFQRQMFLWSLFAFTLTAAIGLYHNRINTSDLGNPPTHEDAYMACRTMGDAQYLEMDSMRQMFVLATGLIYVVSTIGALYFSYSQQTIYQQKELETCDMEDFALLAEGFPKDTGEKKLEAEYVEFFRKAYGETAVVGVSICWDIGPILDEVTDVVRAECSTMDDKYDVDHADSDAARATKPTAEALAEAAPSTDLEKQQEEEAALCHQHTHTQTAEESRASTKRSCLLDPQLRCIDGLLWGTPCMNDEECFDEGCHSEKTTQMLKALPSTGCCFIVFSSEANLQRALYEKPLPKFRNEHELRLSHLHCCASTVQWEGFSTTPSQRLWKIAKGTGIVMLIIVFWAVCFYGPYAHYILSYSRVAGQSQGNFWQNTLLGLLISIGNQIVYYACADVAEKARFRGMDNRMKFSVVLYTLAVFINTIIDMLMTIIMAFGYQHDLEADSMIRNPSMQESLYVQLVGYLYPGTLLIPYFIEPIAMAIAPFYLGKWLIRSRGPGLSREDAEACLVCPQFDLNRYGDHIINVSLVILLFFLTSVNLWFIFMMLLVSMVFVYGWDHYRFLRQCQETWLVTKHMDVCAQYLLAFPCAMLSMAFVFKWYGGQQMVQNWEKNSFLKEHAVWTVGLTWFCVHLVVHIGIVKFVIPHLAPRLRERADNEEQWAQVCKEYAANWFNTNPVHCLRSKHVYEHSPPFVYYQVGKEYLQQKNTEIGAYYEVDNYGKDISFAQDIVDSAKKTHNWAGHVARSVTGGLGHVAHKMTGLVSGRSDKSTAGSETEGKEGSDDKPAT